MTSTPWRGPLRPLVPYSLNNAASRAELLRRIGRVGRAPPWPILLVTVVAGALRFAQLEDVSANQFYDAAVRSMTLSWHNFFFGAFDPSAALSIDKPPLDLWLQVASVKLFGWGRFSLQLPEALAGTLSVPLLYDAVRRVAGRPAALAAAVALAVLPESVLTARSDTMDSVMMLLVIAALWLTIRASATSRRPRRAIVLAGVALGLAFNVKLLEALIVAPALVALYLLARPDLRARRVKLVDMALGGAALVGVGLSWAILASLAPGHHPWAVGSTDGSVWNAMFVFNGFGKVGSASPITKPGGPGPFRLVVSTGWHYDELFGCMLVAALAIGGAAVLWRLRRGKLNGASLPWAFAISLVVWIAFALLAFDTMRTVHARYLEALAPALAATIGLGAAWLAGLAGWPASQERDDATRPSLLPIAIALLGVCAYTFSFKPPSLAWAAAALILSAIGAALIARAPGPLAYPARWLLLTMIVASALVFPVHETLSLVRTKANDSLGLATTAPGNAAVLSSYLQARTAGLRYELAAEDPLSLAPLVIHDQRPILPLTSFGARPLTSLAQLRADIRAGRVRYALVSRVGCAGRATPASGCVPTALWIRRNGIDVTPSVGLMGRERLYLLTPDRAA